MKTLRNQAARALPWALILVLAAPLPFPNTLNPGVSAWVALVVGAIFLAVAVLPSARVELGLGLLCLSLLGFIGWFGFRAATALTPKISLWGTAAQHNGLLMWVAACAWLLAAVALADRRAMRTLLAILSLASAGYALLALVEKAGVGPTRLWGSAAGIFENSSSLGQFLALGIGASVAWALVSRVPWQRWSAIAAAAISAVGLAVAGSRLGWAGVIAGAAFAAVLYARRSRGSAIAISVATPIAAVLISAGFVAGASGAFGAGIQSAISSLGTERDAIWKAAGAAVGSAPVLGRGLEQFSAWVMWSLTQAGGLTFNGTYDPHNFVLALAIGGGVVGLALFLVAGGLLVNGVVATFDRSGRSPVIAASSGALVAVMGSALFTWFAPTAVVSAALLCGTLIALGRETGTEPESARTSAAWRWTWIATTGLVVALALVGAVLVARPLVAENSIARLQRAGSVNGQAYADAFAAWPDPSFAVGALTYYSNAYNTTGLPTDLDSAMLILRSAGAQSRWDVNLALDRVLLAQSESAKTGVDTMGDVRAGVSDGMSADPASGIWYTLGALEAKRAGDDAQAREWAQRALTFPLGTEERAAMEPLAK